MAHASSIEFALRFYPKLYRVLTKELRRAFDERMLYRSNGDLRADAVELFWLLIGQGLVDLTDEHSKRGMFSWKEERNIALAIDNHLIDLIIPWLHTQRDVDVGNFYHHYA